MLMNVGIRTYIERQDIENCNARTRLVSGNSDGDRSSATGI